jgi:hypothetical protein
MLKDNAEGRRGFLKAMLGCGAFALSGGARRGGCAGAPDQKPQGPKASTADRTDLSDLPLLVGGHAHGRRNIEILADLGLGNFVWIPKVAYPMGNTPWDKSHDVMADVEACLRKGFYFMISQRRGLGQVVRPGGFEFGGDCSGDLLDKATVTRIGEKAGKLFVGLHAEELDADMIQSALHPIWRTRTPELYCFTDCAGGRKHFEDELYLRKELYHSYQANFLPNLCVTFHHCGYRIGADLVLAEFLEHLTAVELQLAYLRGGVTQFGKDWGAWVSPWYWGQVPCEDKKLWPSPHAVVGGGHPAWTLRHTLYLAYVSGARLLTVQETEPLFSAGRDGGFMLAAWGAQLKQFWDYARNHQERFQPIISLALLVDKNSGWAPAHLWEDWNPRETLWGKMPVEPSDTMLSSYLNVLLPGYGRTREVVMKRQDTYPGNFVATPYGPFDIVSSDISPERLHPYRVVVILGDVQMSPSLRRTLEVYAQSGGTLLINAVQMRSDERVVQDEKLLGVRIGTRVFPSSKIICTRELEGIGEREFNEPPFWSAEVTPVGAAIVATDGAGHPVLLRHACGKGRVYLAAPEYLLGGGNEHKVRLFFFAQLLESLARNALIQVGTSHPLSWISSRQGENSVVVLLANHGMDEAEVEVACQVGCKAAQVEVGGGKTAMTGKMATGQYAVRVAPQDIVLLRLATG